MEINLLDDITKQDIRICYFYSDKKCTNLAEFIHPNNRHYCLEHHNLVNEINKKRIDSANDVLNKKIIKYCNKIKFKDDDNEWKAGFNEAIKRIIKAIEKGVINE